MQKIGLIRDDINPRNSDLNLDIDWYVEYTNADQDRINFNIVLKSCENFNLNFKVEGILKLDLFEEFIQDECSQVIFYHACNVLMDMVSLTRESIHIISKKEYPDTLCPSCSVGCGLNVIINNGEIVGTFPYKRHPVNAGKNCLNGRNSIECYQNKFDKAIVSKSETDIEKAIEDVSKELGSADSSDVTIICSGNNDMEEIEAIKEFGESKNFNVAFYADNLKDFADVASYDEVAGASKVFVIGDLLYENPLIGRRIVHAKQNGAEIYALGKAEESVTFNIADETSNSTVEEFLEKNKGNIDDDSVIVFNYVDSQDDLDKIEALNCKCLPVFSKSNSKGTLGIIEPKSLDEMLELLDNTKVLLVFNDDIADELEYDFTKISKIISFAPCSNKTTEISDIVIPTKTWLEKEGSFVNAMGETQTFTAAVESDALSEIEIIEKLNG